MADSKPRVLLVEDDPFMTTLMAQGLGEAGFEVTHAANGEDAVRQFSMVTPNAIILDIMLPKKNGLEALREIRALPGGEDVPALVLSNLEEASYAREAHELGVTAYLVKANMQISDIVAKVKEALRQ